MSRAVSARYLGQAGTGGRMTCSVTLLAQVENRACQTLPSPERRAIRQERTVLKEGDESYIGKKGPLKNNGLKKKK